MVANQRLLIVQCISLALHVCQCVRFSPSKYWRKHENKSNSCRKLKQQSAEHVVYIWHEDGTYFQALQSVLQEGWLSFIQEIFLAAIASFHRVFCCEATI